MKRSGRKNNEKISKRAQAHVKKRKNRWSRNEAASKSFG